MNEFISTIPECPEDDLLHLAKTVAAEFPIHASIIRDITKLPSPHRLENLRHAFRQLLEREVERRQQPLLRGRRPEQSEEVHVDNTLRKAQAILGNFSSEQWEKMTSSSGKTVDEFRRTTWKRVCLATYREE